MAFFDWKEDYSVGIAKIDEQHKKLVSFLNDLYSGMKEGRGNERIGAVLEGMVAYTATHFATEENLMKLYKFPGYEMHREKHQAMTQTVGKLYEKFKKEAKPNTLEIAKYLKAWLENHIMGTDRQYQAFLNSKGVK